MIDFRLYPCSYINNNKTPGINKPGILENITRWTLKAALRAFKIRQVNAPIKH